eukprot:TRINITY_DN423_c0_g1_i2.p1 TRINITY_DN423_c0_g1~~TRINITY_DN423_c0_g1_i2.p1  ORF type:complete len:856 (-),score=278.60 TRINITY_DN423_c0_g1_i2:56-2623(-)
MDEEILKLQQELMAVQKTESRRALSERNVVELLIKLRELGLVRFIHSVNGREMITPEQLIREIEMVIWQKRRISVVDIPNELGVDFVHVDSSISAVLERNAKEFQKIGNEILTQSYLDDLAVELSEELNMSGSMTVTDVATKKSLPAEFVVAFLKEQIYRGLLSAQMDGNTLLTHSYLSKERARVLGAFLGICTPVAIRNVASQHGMREDHCIRALQELVREGHVHGVVEQGGSVFVPHRFKIAQKRALVNFFNQNGFLSHDRVEKARINLDMKRLVEEEGWDGILLSNVFFGRNVLDRVDEEIVSSLSIGSQNQEKEKECDVVDIVGLLPEIIDSNEVSKLLAECPRTQVGIRSGNILTVAHSTVLANKDLERKAQEHVIELLTRKIEEWAADRNKRGDGSLSPVSKPKPKKAAKGDRKARKKRGGKGKRKGKRGDDSDDDDDDDAGAGQSGESERGVSKAPYTHTDILRHVTSFLSSFHQIEVFQVESENGMGDELDLEEWSHAIASHIGSAVEAQLDVRIIEVLDRDARRRKTVRERVERIINKALPQMFLLLHGNESLLNGITSQAEAKDHETEGENDRLVFNDLFHTLSLAILDAILIDICVKYRVPVPFEQFEGRENVVEELTMENCPRVVSDKSLFLGVSFSQFSPESSEKVAIRAQLISKFPSQEMVQTTSMLKEIKEAAKSGQLNVWNHVWTTLVEFVYKSCEMNVKKPDRKAVKSECFRSRVESNAMIRTLLPVVEKGDAEAIDLFVRYLATLLVNINFSGLVFPKSSEEARWILESLKSYYRVMSATKEEKEEEENECAVDTECVRQDLSEKKEKVLESVVRDREGLSFETASECVELFTRDTD